MLDGTIAGIGCLPAGFIDKLSSVALISKKHQDIREFVQDRTTVSPLPGWAAFALDQVSLLSAK